MNIDRIRKALQFASEIIPKLPAKEDGPLAILVKVLGIIDSLDSASRLKTSFLHDFFAKLKAENSTNAQFIDLFFNTPVKDIFIIKTMRVDDHVNIVQATHEEIGTLHFLEYRWGSMPEYSNDFWFSAGFRFDRVLERLWDAFHGQIHVEVIQDERRGRPKTLFSQMPMVTDELQGQGQRLLGRLLEREQRAAQEGLRPTYLFLGKPGVGKTTVATQMAQALGGRCLRLDATGLTMVGVKDLDFLLSQLKPSFLLIDDIDKCAMLPAVLPTLLTMLSDMRSKHPELRVVLTAATAAGLDPALLRPRRIDKVIEFDPPTFLERIAILQARGVHIDRAKDLADATDGLTAAYLHGVAEQLLCGDELKEVLADIARHKKMIEPKSEQPLPEIHGAALTPMTLKAG